jgi:hypothetical protein
VSDEVGEPCPFESSDYEEPFEHPFAEDEVHIVPSSDQHDPLFVGDSACTVFGSRIQHLLQGGNPLPHCHSRKYFNSHSLHRMSISSWDLPEKAYAKLLIQVMLRFAGESYFLALRDETMRKIDDTYTESNCNPVWLCKLFAMLAVGELYSKTTSRADSQLAAPGVGFFMQAVSMQQDLYEEANADYIELLVLMVGKSDPPLPKDGC